MPERYPPGSAPNNGASVAIAFGLVLVVGLAVLGARQVGLGLGRERIAERVAATVAVLGVVDQVGLGLLEALGLATARLVHGAHLGIEVVLITGDPTDLAG